MKPLSLSRFTLIGIFAVVALLTSPLWFGIPSWVFAAVGFVLGAMVLVQYQRTGRF